MSFNLSITNATLEPLNVEEDEDYLAILSDDEYVDFVANFLRPTFIEYCFVAVFLFQMLVGIVGNCFVVYVVSRNRTMWTSMNLFLSNLACSDLLVLVFCLPPTVLNDITKTFWFSSTSCKAILFAQNTSVYVSVLTLMCISFERWKAICDPLALPFCRTQRVIVAVWLLASIAAAPEPITLKIYPAEYARQNLTTTWGARCKESWSGEFQQKYQLTQTIGLFIAPLTIISALCTHMSLALKRKALQIGTRQVRDRKRAIRMLIMVVMVFALTQSPVHLHNIATIRFSAFNWEVGSEELSLTLVAWRKFIPRFMSYSSSCLNPILYSFVSGKFRKEFRHVFHALVHSNLRAEEELKMRRQSTITRQLPSRHHSIPANGMHNNGTAVAGAEVSIRLQPLSGNHSSHQMLVMGTLAVEETRTKKRVSLANNIVIIGLII